MPPKYVYNNAARGSGHWSKPAADKVAKNQECKVCEGNKNYTQWVLCDGCDFWYHPKCLGRKPPDSRSADPFYCNNCSRLSGNEVRPEGREDTQQVETEQIEGSFSPDGGYCPDGEEMQLSNLAVDSEAQTLEPIASTSGQRTTFIPEELVDEDPCATTDDEGNSEITGVLGYRCPGPNRGQFKVRYRSNSEEAWVPIKRLDGCVDMIERFLIKNDLPLEYMAGLGYRQGCGSSNPTASGKENWAQLDDIISAANTYGIKNSLKVTAFSELGSKDALHIVQVGAHCFTVLYWASSRHCLIADGENTFVNNMTSRRLLLTKLSGVKRISFLPFYDQREVDFCGSSAAAIAVEFQKIYKEKSDLREVRVAKSVIARIKKVLHKAPAVKIREWAPITNQAKRSLKCDACGKAFKTTNRGALNLHKCG